MVQQYAEVGSKDPQEDSPLTLLPREMIENILKFLDPLSSVRLSCTCALFYNLVNQVAKWKTWTMKIMEDPCMPHLANAGLHFGVPSSEPQELLPNETHIPWKQLFYCLQFWNMMKKWNFSLTYETLIEKDRITSMDIAGQNIIFGTSQGGLGVWNPDENLDLQALHRFRSEVFTVLVRLCPGSSPRPRYQIIVKCRDRTTNLFDITESTVKTLGASSFTAISSSNNRNIFYEWNPDSGFLGHLSIHQKSVEMKQFPQLAVYPVVAVYGNQGSKPKFPKREVKQIFNNFVVSRSKGPAIVSFFERPSGQILQRYDHLLPDNNLCIYKAYIWPGQISFSLTGGSITVLSVGHQVKKIRWPSWRCTAAALFANIFLVGTNTGTILCYPIKTPSDLLNLDPEEYIKKLETESNESLVYVGVRVQNDVHLLPDIVGASTSKIFCFRAV